MIGYLAAGILISFAGSIHCIGMCGPIALAIPVHSSSTIVKLIKILFYNIGRITSYVFIGLLLGLIGKSFSLGGILQYFSIAAGIFLVYMAIKSKLPKLNSNVIPGLNYLKIGFTTLLGSKSMASIFLLGIFNGLLPCGMVLIAGAAAVATGSIQDAMILMAGFGFGTLPVMVGLTLSKTLMSINLRQRMNKAMPVVICALGLLLIVRGLNLGIPYLSPKFEGEKVQRCH